MVEHVEIPIQMREQRTFVFVHLFIQVHDVNRRSILVLVCPVLEAPVHLQYEMVLIFHRTHANVSVVLPVRIVMYPSINVHHHPVVHLVLVLVWEIVIYVAVHRVTPVYNVIKL